MWDHKIEGPGHEIPVQFFTGSRKKTHPVLLFFHGGGWVTAISTATAKVCQELARHTQHTVAAVDYRLAPEHRFPGRSDGLLPGRTELFTQPGLLGVTADEITMIGDSAGGNLAAAVSPDGTRPR